MRTAAGYGVDHVSSLAANRLAAVDLIRAICFVVPLLYMF